MTFILAHNDLPKPTPESRQRRRRSDGCNGYGAIHIATKLQASPNWTTMY